MKLHPPVCGDGCPCWVREKGSPNKGACHASPPGCQLVPVQNLGGQQQLMTIATRPPILDSEPACRLHPDWDLYEATYKKIRADGTEPEPEPAPAMNGRIVLPN